ncbi:hypothetical protein HMPREF9946_00937 [Acetobacteraceae bacterium AT-5844]|nr:hypothetical protein HMPREF9946_00937 [Acetobacteraceae bacterium AT-5844]
MPAISPPYLPTPKLRIQRQLAKRLPKHIISITHLKSEECRL